MHVLFDLDGTLTDPFVGITRCIQYALEKLGRDVPPAEGMHWCIGPPLLGTFCKLLESDDHGLANRALEYYRERFSETGMFENKVYPEIRDSLEKVAGAGIGMSVATSKPRVFAKRIVQHFGLAEFFTAVDGSELDGTRVDKSDLIEYILERDRHDPTDVVMVGDRSHDMVGAVNNGVIGVGVLWGYGSMEELGDAGASACVESPANLAQLILDKAASG